MHAIVRIDDAEPASSAASGPKAVRVRIGSQRPDLHAPEPGRLERAGDDGTRAREAVVILGPPAPVQLGGGQPEGVTARPEHDAVLAVRRLLEVQESVNASWSGALLPSAPRPLDQCVPGRG